MRKFPGIRPLFRLPASPARVARDVDDELAFHLAAREDELVAQGMTRDAAHAQATREFGDVARVTADCVRIDLRHERRRRFDETLGSVWQDVRYAARSFARAPTVAVAVAATIALGVGATTAIYSVVHSVLVRPLPYAAPDRLVQLWETSTTTPGDRNPVSVPNYRDWTAAARSFDAVGAYAFNRYTVVGEGGLPEQVQGSQLLGNVFGVLGVPPLLGRTLGPADDREHVVVLSEGMWRGRFGADPAVVGRSMRMNGQPYTVVGVMPASFRFPRPDVELWSSYATILTEERMATGRGFRFQRVVARLRPGVSAERADAELRAVANRLAAQYPDDNPGGGAMAVPLKEQLVGDLRPALLVLLAAVGCVLLIACANVAHLLLARAAAREREFGVRVALGAAHGRIVRQLLTEGIALAVAGGAVGTALAYAGVGLLVRNAPESLPRAAEIAVDGRVLLFALATSVLTGLAASAAPAVRGARAGLAAAARSGARLVGPPRHGAHALLVVAEIAASFVLLTGAGLLVQSFRRLRAVDVGADASRVTTMLVAASPVKYATPERQRELFARVAERVAALPGVESLGMCDCMPPDQPRTYTSFLVDGASTDAAARPGTNQLRAGASYFATLRIPVLAGRAFTDADRGDAPPVAVVSETLARRHLLGRAAPGGSGARGLDAAIGRRITFDDEHWLTVVGVVGDVRYDGVGGELRPAAYTPFAQYPFPAEFLFVRSSFPQAQLVPAIRRALVGIDPMLPVSRVASLGDVVSDSVAGERFTTTLLTLFAGLAFTLAAVGVYGVVSYGVGQRTREIGIRMALGAVRASVVREVMWRGLRPVLVGVVVGVGAAVAAAGVVARLLYATSPHDPAIYAAITVLLVGAAAGACLLPARRAAATDPMHALRGE